MSVLKQLQKISGNNLAFSLADETNPYQVDHYIDTGCYILNAILGNGDIYSGFPVGKRVTLGGPSSTAKSFFGAHILRAFLNEDPENNYVVFFESEGASLNEMATTLNIDKKRVIVLPVYTVEEFKSQAVKMLDEILEIRGKAKKGEKKQNFMFVLDSLGMLASDKEYQDTLADKQVADMSRNRVLKSIFRLITLKLSMTQTPLLVISHSYQEMGLFPKTIISGGTGLGYASDVALVLSKAQQKEGTEHVGAIITLTVDKSRFIVEKKKAKVTILFKKGINKYSFLLDLGIELGVFEKDGKKLLFNGTEYKVKAVERKPEEFFTKEVLDVLAPKIKQHYGFSGTNVDTSLEDDDDTEE